MVRFLSLLVLMSLCDAIVEQFELLQLCREFPKTNLPCFNVETLRSERRHTLFIPLRNVSGVALGLHSKYDTSNTFAMFPDLFVVPRVEVDPPFSEIVIDTELDENLQLHAGDTISLCALGDICIPCIDRFTSFWNGETCLCNLNAKEIKREVVKSLEYPEAEVAHFAERVTCQQCGEYEIADDGFVNGESRRVCKCAPTFGESTAPYEASLGIAPCRCEKGYYPAGSTLDGTAACVMCSGSSFKLQVGNDPCLSCPEGEISDEDSLGRDCKCPEGKGFVLDPNQNQLDQWLNSERNPRCLCEAGFQLSGQGCTMCDYDSFKSSVGRQNCSLCPSTFIADEDRIACVCPDNSFEVIDPTTQEAARCQCNKGFQLSKNGRTCDPCATNTFRDEQEVCTNCPDLTFSLEGSSQCECMPGAELVASQCECLSTHVLRYAEDPINFLPEQVPKPPSSARTQVLGIDHPLYGPGRTFTATAKSPFELLEGVYVDSTIGFVDVEIFLYRPARERERWLVRLYSTNSSTMWGHRIANTSLLGVLSLSGTLRTDWRQGDVMVVANLAPYNQYCLPCRDEISCSLCSQEGTQYLGVESNVVCNQPQPHSELPCDIWAPGTETCAPCPLLEVSPNGSCVCAAGHEPNPLSPLRCHACPQGTFKANPGDYPCEPCADGFVASEGSSICSACPASAAAPRNSAECVPCEANSSPEPTKLTTCVCNPEYFRLQGSCVLCPGNSFKPAYGDAACVSCPPLQSNYPEGQRLSCSCDPGAERNGSSCHLCLLDQFKPLPGDHACSPCENRLGTSGRGAIQQDECKCGRGFYNVTAHCEACPANTFQDQVDAHGLESCRQCPFRYFQPLPGSSDCVPQNVMWPGQTLDLVLVGLEVTATGSCAMFSEVLEDIGVFAKRFCWGDGEAEVREVQGEAVEALSHVCGDGVVFPGEECDDGNAYGGDGCSAECSIEDGYVCNYRDSADYLKTLSEPSQCCREEGNKATCTRCWERPTPVPGTRYNGYTCELEDINECQSAFLNSCWQTGASCVNLFGSYNCTCEDKFAACHQLKNLAQPFHHSVKLVVQVEDGEVLEDVEESLRNSAYDAVQNVNNFQIFSYSSMISANTSFLAMVVLTQNLETMIQLSKHWNVSGN